MSGSLAGLKMGIVKGLVGWSSKMLGESLARNKRQGKRVRVLNRDPVDLLKAFREKEAAANKNRVGPGKKARTKDDWPSYVNSKGERVYVIVSKHALERFKGRSEKLYRIKLDHPEDVLVKQFNSAHRITELNNRQRRRVAKYKGDTLFFKFMEMVFVVCDATIVTVELSGKKTRLLN